MFYKCVISGYKCLIRVLLACYKYLCGNIWHRANFLTNGSSD